MHINSDDFDNEDWEVFMGDIKTPIEETYNLGKKDIGSMQIDFNIPDLYATNFAANRAAELVTNIKANTMERLNRIITGAIKEGLGPGGLRNAILEDFAFSRERSQLIARTEMAMAYNSGAIDALKSSDTQAVQCLDGLSGDSDTACTEADGMIISVDLAGLHPIQHPNCVRSFSPVVGENIDIQDTEFLAVVQG